MLNTIDRTGKGLRTAPRDALITLSTPPRLYGRAFGVHRMMDTIGAFAGPLVADQGGDPFILSRAASSVSRWPGSPGRRGPAWWRSRPTRPG